MDVWILRNRFGIKVFNSEEKALTYAKDYIIREYRKGNMEIFEYKKTLQDLGNREYLPWTKRVVIEKKTII